ncbi:VOC family protein [Shigella flexneri]
MRCRRNVTLSAGVAGFEQCGDLSENLINGRPICLFKLHEPVQVAHWRFSLVELPWPGKNVTHTKVGNILKSSAG